MSVLVENHSHSCQWSSNGTTWHEFGDLVENIATDHDVDGERGTTQITCYAYPDGLDLSDQIIAYLDGATVFDGFFIRPELHGYEGSVVLQCEGRGGLLARPWGGQGSDPELDDELSRRYEGQTTGDIITNLAEAAGAGLRHSIVDDGVTRGTLNAVVLRVGQSFWSLIRGDDGLDVIRNYRTFENNAGDIVRQLFAVSLTPDFTYTEGVNILVGSSRAPQGNESIVNRCIVWGFEYEGATFGGIGIGDYEQESTPLGTGVRQAKTIRNQFIEDDAEALETATLYVVSHNFPTDSTTLIVPGEPTITIGQTVLIDAPNSLNHAGDDGALRFVAKVNHRYGVGGYTTQIVCVRTTNEL